MKRVIRSSVVHAKSDKPSSKMINKVKKYITDQLGDDEALNDTDGKKLSKRINQKSN